jgi:carbon storage regulator
MLVLTRKSGQKLIIANDIEIVILEIRGDAVKIGIEAPKHITIYREEIYEEIKKSNQKAGSEKLSSTGLDLAAQAIGKINPNNPKLPPNNLIKPFLIRPEQE